MSFKVMSRLYVEHFKVIPGFGVEDHPRPFLRSYLKIVQNVIQGTEPHNVIRKIHFKDYFKVMNWVRKITQVRFRAISIKKDQGYLKVIPEIHLYHFKVISELDEEDHPRPFSTSHLRIVP